MKGHEATGDEPAIGALFADRYAVEALLGRGGMGAVYRVRDLCMSEPVALKFLSLGAEASPAAVLRFRDEVRLARRVTHPNVARVYDIGEHRGLFYLTMELVQGETLAAILGARGRLAPARAAAITLALCDGLEAAHAAGIVHRDLKPANVLIEGSGRVVITDFGIAKCLDGGSDLTVGILGTPRYMAPEQASGGLIDARTDLYALGFVLGEMLVGKKLRGGPAEIAAQLEGAGAPALTAVARRCIAADPSARPSSAREVARLVAEAAPTGAPSLPSLTPPETEDEPTSRVATTTSEPVLAVLPFRYQGPPEHDYLGDAIAEEIVDALSRIRGLHVLGSGATARFRDARDPHTVGAALGARALVEGTVQRLGERLRITVRLVDAASGVQLSALRHEGALSDLFVLEESVARRVAEELRVQITTFTRRAGAPSEVVERYLAARQKLRTFDYASIASAAEDLERCLALAPAFTPAVSAHAIACIRAWFLEVGDGPRHDWETAARAAVERTLAAAPDIAESHLCAGMLATQDGDQAAAAASLTRALALAPSSPDALEYLGVLQCESGQTEAGVKRLELATELEPMRVLPLVYLARHHALHGRADRCDATLAEIDRRQGPGNIGAFSMRVRVAAWRGDRQALARLAALDGMGESRRWEFMRFYASAALGREGDDHVDAIAALSLGYAKSPRTRVMLEQLLAELYAARGAAEPALRHLGAAASGVLVDLEWLDRCPLFAPLRERPELAAARALTRARAAGLWSA